MSENDTARKISPFKVIERGQDTIDKDDDVIFADFSPRVLPADTPEETVVPAPKGESVVEPAPSSESSETTEPKSQDKTAPEPAAKDSGKPKANASGTQVSSSPKKTG